MAKRTDIKKILVIGSGPIVIGQAAEFDYAGTQACLALKEEGYEVVLCNSNPATIMTDTSIADKVYMEPLTLEYMAKIIRYERPDAILPGIGGQTGLNLAMQLEKKGVLAECRVELLGTKSSSIERAEDRELFKELCESLGEPVLPSDIANSIEEGVTAYGGNAIFEKGCELISEGASIQGMNRLYTGTGMAENREKKLLKAVKAAKEADKVVLCIGEHMAQTGEAASRGDITIPENQITLLEKIAEVNQNIVVVLFSGRPLDLRKVKTLAKAILVVWMPGTEGGSAIAEVLYGETPPSGKLPMSFPYAVGQVPVFYSEFHTGRRMDPAHPENSFQSRYMDIPNEPLYPFGYGLSYTEFSYSVVTLSKTELIRGGELKASVLLKNVGKSRGSEVVQMYIRDDVGSVARPIRELKGFQKLWLNAGEEKEVSFTITEDMLKFHDINMNNIAEAGKFTVFIGSDSRTQNQAEFVLK